MVASVVLNYLEEHELKKRVTCRSVLVALGSNTTAEMAKKVRSQLEIEKPQIFKYQGDLHEEAVTEKL